MTISMIPSAAPATPAASTAPGAAAVGPDAGASGAFASGDPSADAASQALFASLLGAEIGLLGQGASAAPAATTAVPSASSDASKDAASSTTDTPAAAAAVSPLPDLAAQIMAQSAMMSAMQPPAPMAQPAALPDGAAPGPSSGSAGVEALAAGSLLGAGKLASDKDDGQAGALQNLPDKGTGEKILPFQEQQQQQLSATAAAAHGTPGQTVQQTPTALPATTFTVSTPVGDQTWSRQVGSQVLAMVSLKADHAQIQVSPPELGPITVSLKLDGNANTAQVMFSADSAATREALQNSLPRLSEMMAASGIQLSDAQVSSQSQGQRQASGQQGKPSRRNDEGTPEEIETLTTTLRSTRMLSTYA
jgi:flagellar hook-length control protein FliK